MSQTDLERRLVQTRIGAVHTVVRSGVGRPLLLLHMSPRSSRMYLPVMAQLDRTVAAIDRPGFGASDAPDLPPTMVDYAAASLAVVDALGWDAFDVVGTHTGSVEAVEIAHQAPGRVGTVGIVAVPAYTPDEIAERRHGVAAPRPVAASDGGHLRAMWRRRLDIRTPPHDLEHLRDLFVDEVVSMPTVHWAYEAVLAYPMLERMAGVERLVVFAPHDDLWDLTRRAREHLPRGAAFVELTHLDFDLWERAPAEMAALLGLHVPGDR